MQKLLIATDCFLPRWDGIARFLSELIPTLKDSYEITVLAPDHGPYEPEGFKLIKVPLSRFTFGDFKAAKPQFKLTKKLVMDSDIVFCQTIGPVGALAIYYGKKLKKPVISYTHSLEWELVPRSLSYNKFLQYFSHFISKIISKFLYNRTTMLIVPSKETAEILQINGIKTKKAIIEMGINTNKFIPPENKQEAKQKLNINPDNTVIGFSGRIAMEKDLMTLYRAFLKISKNFPKTNLLIIGKGLQKQEQILKSKQNIILSGSVNKIIPYLQAMDIYVLPSLTETSSLSTMEAMSSGLAVVTTKVGCLKDYIKDKENGLFFPKSNSLVLSMKLKQLLENKTLINKLGLAARQTAIEKFSFEKTASKIKKVLSEY